MKDYRVLIVEDAARVRERLMILLSGIKGISVISAMHFSPDAICSISLLHPDAVLLSIRPGDPRALSLLREIKQGQPNTYIIALSDAPCRECRDRYLAAGADLFLDKAEECDRIGPELLLASGMARHEGSTASPE